ncbi:MAG: HAMP domain-containing protein [Anaerolineales bacterium]|nr:HAMP domain-containing protein [Anaerolineales bacterium]
MKLTSKLILAFLVVSLFSTGIIVLITRVATNREFDRFISDQYKAELVEQLANHYQKNRTWEGLENNFKPFDNDHYKPGNDRPLFFSIADANGKIVVAGSGYWFEDIVSAREIDAGTPIQVEGETVGILLIDSAPEKNPIEDEFIHRLNDSIFFSAAGTVILALILGTILSRTITRPIRELTKVTHEMADGKLGQQVPVRSRDEIGELASSFNKMNNELARSLNLRKQMTADIAHELRTPLSLIIGHAEGVHDGVLQPSHENFEIIREEADRLEKLVNDLRTLSLADAGELSVEFQPVDINELLSDIKTHYMTLFNQKRITLDLVPAPATLRVKANLDPIRFSQVLTNILDNALRYTPEEGQVVMAVSKVENQVEISIQDNGEGVTPEEAAHLFDRFYRADPSRTRDRDAGGSGLGLAIAKSIIEMHQGRIWVESEKGKGMKTIIRLPLARD